MTLLLAIALAQEAAPLDEEDTARVEDEVDYDSVFVPPALEIIIHDHAVDRARQQLDADLVDLGYTRTRRKDDRTVYLHETGWRQKVVVHDDGWVYFRQRPPHLQRPKSDPGMWWHDTAADYMICLANPLACVSAGSVFVRPKLREQDKARALDGVGPEVVQLADAIADEALQELLFEDLPERLESIWYEGVDPVYHSEFPAPEERRRHILDYWLSRNDNVYGDAVRVVVETFMAYEIQTSPFPYTEDEIRWANETRRCSRPLVLPSPMGI